MYNMFDMLLKTLHVDCLGKSIDDICSNGFTKVHARNHCAHFVSHVLGIRFGELCGNLPNEKNRGKGGITNGTGATIRCNELYNGLTSRGKWENRPAFADGLLIFVTPAGNVRALLQDGTLGTMGTDERKHVGIYFSGRVYHYSNGGNRVIVDPTVERFHDKFKGQYGRKNNVSLFFAVVPYDVYEPHQDVHNIC